MGDATRPDVEWHADDHDDVFAGLPVTRWPARRADGERSPAFDLTADPEHAPTVGEATE